MALSERTDMMHRFYPKNGADLYWYMNESTVTGRSGYVRAFVGYSRSAHRRFMSGWSCGWKAVNRERTPLPVALKLVVSCVHVHRIKLEQTTYKIWKWCFGELSGFLVHLRHICFETTSVTGLTHSFNPVLSYVHGAVARQRLRATVTSELAGMPVPR